MNHKYLVALTFQEFQVLFSSSELRIARNRLIAIPVDSDGRPNFILRGGREVLERAPHFDVEAEHSMLIGVIDQLPENMPPDIGTRLLKPISPEVFYLSINTFESFHALTERGGRILSSRLEGFELDLKPPLFEMDVLETISDWILRRSLAGAAALVQLITGDTTFQVTTSFADQAIEALDKVHKGMQLPLADGAFLNSLFCYERHQILSKNDIGYLMDLGLVLKDSLQEKSEGDILAAFRKLVKALENSPAMISNFINLPDLKKVLDEIQPSSDDKLRLALAILFIRWKHLALNSSNFDLSIIFSDVKEANESFSPKSLKQLIWLFGLYWGIDRQVPGFYLSFPKSYRFLTDGKMNCHEPIILSEIETGKDPLRKAEEFCQTQESISEKPDELELKVKSEMPSDLKTDGTVIKTQSEMETEGSNAVQDQNKTEINTQLKGPIMEPEEDVKTSVGESKKTNAGKQERKNNPDQTSCV